MERSGIREQLEKNLIPLGKELAKPVLPLREPTQEK